MSFLSHDRRMMMERRRGVTSELATRDGSKKQVGKYYETPDIPYGSVWCASCQKPCDFDETFAHNTGNPARSRIYIRAYCHGANCDVFLSFQQWHDSPKKLIQVFEDVSLGGAEVLTIEAPQESNLAALKTVKAKEIPASPVLLLCWKGQPSI